MSVIDFKNMDCLKFMRTLPDKAFDLAISDPPYGIKSFQGCGKLKDRPINAIRAKYDSIPPKKAFFKELSRISKHQIIFGANYFGLPKCRCFFVWDKCQPWSNFSACEYAWTSFDKPAKLFRFDTRSGKKIHPTQKPEELYKYLLSTFAKQGWTIFDSHAGSGSLAIACHELGYDYAGTEIDPVVFERAQNRLAKALSQPFMNLTPKPKRTK